MKKLHVPALVLSILAFPLFLMGNVELKPVPKDKLIATGPHQAIKVKPAICTYKHAATPSDVIKLNRIIRRDGVVTPREAAMMRMLKKRVNRRN